MTISDSKGLASGRAFVPTASDPQAVPPVPASIPDAADHSICPDCDGEGWLQENDYEDQCCGGSDWECGARGCTGPIKVPIAVQVECERCLGSGGIFVQGMEARQGGDEGSVHDSPVHAPETQENSHDDQ